MVATLGQLIRERRMELNLTQEELAERIGIGVRQSEISRLERNRVSLPRRQRMEEIAAALEVPIGLLLARSGWAGAETIESDPANDHGVAGRVAEATTDPDDAVVAVPAPTSQRAHVHSLAATSDLEEAPHLNDAIARAETLIGQSQSIHSLAQTTILQARESVRRRHATDN